MKSLKLLVSTLASTAALAVSLSAVADTSNWNLDASHSRVGFSVSHLVVSSVSGRFKAVTGTVALDEQNLAKSQVSITIQANSIDTDEPKRDEHLRSADFFDVAKYPVIGFESKQITPAGGSKYKLAGWLTMHGVTKPVALEANISKAIKNPWGKMVRAVKINGKLKRSDFGLTWNKTLDAGGVVVGDEVTLDIQVELTK